MFTVPVGSGKTMYLWSGYVGGIQYAWTKFDSSASGNQIWLDYSTDGGANWPQCDLRTLDSGRNYGTAFRASSDTKVKMRAGSRPKGGASQTSNWWSDKTTQNIDMKAALPRSTS
ncbi:hypothetical protein [Dactylosporangium sp. NPDC048998]|uniref:hypothetical protein n=1 Tax=Dactylosporangium sp. NPDC048998 TaxID=3363976 RepID=UPI0037157644